MLAEATLTTDRPNTLVEKEPSHPVTPPVTPYSLTLVLTYLHHYTPERLPNGRFIAPKHLRNLARWIGQPSPQLRSLRQHRILAAHIALLHAAGFLTSCGSTILPQPTISNWLHMPFVNTIATLQQTLGCPVHLQTALAELGLQELLKEDYLAYLSQSLVWQLRFAPMETSSVVWLDKDEPQTWQLDLPLALPLWLHFDLRQLGHWQPNQPLVCTPLTVATAVQRGYGRDVIQWLLETATQRPLPEKQHIQLNEWSRRAHVYRLRTVRLLSVPQPHHLDVLLRGKQFRRAVIEQLSPRHVIIHTDIAPALETWLAEQGFPLSYFTPAKKVIIPGSAEESPHSCLSTGIPPRSLVGMTDSTAYQWLSLRVLIGLGRLIPLSCPIPHGLLDTLGEPLSDLEKTELEATAVSIVQSLGEAIHGRDAFFPSQEPASPTLITGLQHAIAQETTLTIAYQALGDQKPTCRQIQPLRLEKYGELTYLYAYCFRAETNLTFRLDRIKEMRHEK